MLSNTATNSVATPFGELVIDIACNSAIQVVCADMPKQLENGMTIDHSRAVLIKVQPGGDSVQLQVKCELNNNELIGAAETGQYVDCIEWFDEHWHVTIGTEDTERLAQRYPNVEIVEAPYPVCYHDTGITMDLTMNRVHQSLSFHVIVSSKKSPDERDCSAWFFADRWHADVLDAVSLKG